MKFPRLRTIGLVILLTALTAPSSRAFFGNISIGGFHVPCAVGCGGSRGVVNLGFGGDLLNAFVTGPSIDNFQNAANGAVDRAMQQLDSQRKTFVDDLTKLANNQRDQLIAQLSTVSTETIDSLDSTLRRQLADADRLLEARLGTLDALLSKQTTDFTYALQRLFIFVVVLAAASYLAWLIYQRKFIQKRSLASLLPSVGWGAAATLAFALVAYGVTAGNQAIARKQFINHFENEYETALSNLNLDHAAYYATQLYFLNRDDATYQSHYFKTGLLRDVFYRPALYRTADGAREFIQRLSSASRGDVRANKNLDPDLKILYGFISWQRGNDRFSEYFAACVFASAISDFKNKKNTEFTTLLPFAFYYLTAYLTNPLPDEVVSKLLADQKVDPQHPLPRTAEAAIDYPLFEKFYSVAELRQAATGANLNIDELAKSYPIYSYVKISMEAVKNYRAVVSRYAELMRLSGLEVVADPAAKPGLRSQIRSVASDIVANWDGYESFLKLNNYDESSAKLNSLKGLWPIYTRAVMASKLADNADVWTAGEEKAGIQNAWLTDVVQPNVRDSAFRLISLVTHSDYITNDAKLDALEKLMRSFFDATKKLQSARASGDANAQNAASGPVVTTARQIALAAAELGIFGCKSSKQESFDCTVEDSLPQPLGQLVFDLALGVTPKLADDDKAVQKLVDARTIPAF